MENTMKNLFVLFLLVTASTVFGQQPTPTPASPMAVMQAVQVADVTAEPKVVGTYQVGTPAVVKFRVRFSNGYTTSDFRTVPALIATYDSMGKDVTAETTRCRLELGECTVKADKPRILHIGVYTGSFGRQTVTLNFVNMRYNLPALVDVTASQTQAQEGTSVTLVATSPVTIEGPVSVRYRTMYTNDLIDTEVYLPGGIQYGERVVINTEAVLPLLFRDRRTFRVELVSTQTGQVVARGFGSTVGLSEWKGIEASLDMNGDLVFTLDEPYVASYEYTVTLLRGNRFRVELAQSRGELYAYPEGNKVKLIFNRGSLGENAYFLPHGYYTVNVQAHDRASGVSWTKARTDALGLTGEYTLR